MVKAPDRRTAKLLDQTVDLMFRIYVIRGACSEAASALLKKNRRDHLAVEDCARLDDTLAKVYRSLQSTVRVIQRSRARKRRPAAE
jgi:hypothetical protein